MSRDTKVEKLTSEDLAYIRQASIRWRKLSEPYYEGAYNPYHFAILWKELCDLKNGFGLKILHALVDYAELVEQEQSCQDNQS